MSLMSFLVSCLVDFWLFMQCCCCVAVTYKENGHGQPEFLQSCPEKQPGAYLAVLLWWSKTVRQQSLICSSWPSGNPKEASLEFWGTQLFSWMLVAQLERSNLALVCNSLILQCLVPCLDFLLYCSINSISLESCARRCSSKVDPKNMCTLIEANCILCRLPVLTRSPPRMSQLHFLTLQRFLN